MAHTVTLLTSGPPCAVATLAGWLTDRGEPFVQEGDDTLVLRALPMRIVSSQAQPSVQAHIDVTPNVPLTRVVDSLFEISVKAGADVHLVGQGNVTRAELWIRLADEQDRLRIGQALRRAREHGNADEVHKRLWGVVASLRPGRDDRWDASAERVVEMVEKTGDVVAMPVVGTLHCLVWRWLSEAYPGIAEPDLTLH